MGALCLGVNIILLHYTLYKSNALIWKTEAAGVSNHDPLSEIKGPSPGKSGTPVVYTSFILKKLGNTVKDLLCIKTNGAAS